MKKETPKLGSHEAKLFLNFIKKVKEAWSPADPVPDIYRSESYSWWMRLDGDVPIPLEISAMLEKAYVQGQERVKDKVSGALNEL